MNDYIKAGVSDGEGIRRWDVNKCGRGGRVRGEQMAGKRSGKEDGKLGMRERSQITYS